MTRKLLGHRPFHLTIGDKGLAQGMVELKRRNTGEVVQLRPADVIPHVQDVLSSYDLPVG